MDRVDVKQGDLARSLCVLALALLWAAEEYHVIVGDTDSETERRRSRLRRKCSDQRLASLDAVQCYVLDKLATLLRHDAVLDTYTSLFPEWHGLT